MEQKAYPIDPDTGKRIGEKLKPKPKAKKVKRHPVPSLADPNKAGLINTNTEKMLKELGY